MVTINIEKRHLIVFFLAISVMMGVFFAYAWVGDSTGNPQVMGHSVGEMDWSKPIIKNINVIGNLSLGGESDGRRLWVRSAPGATTLPVAFMNSQKYGVVIGGFEGETRGAIQGKSPTGAADLVLNPNGGNLIIGSSASIKRNPICRAVTPSGVDFVTGNAAGTMEVPSECINSKCFIYITSGDANINNAYTYFSYEQITRVFDGNTLYMWETSKPAQWARDNGELLSGANGDTQEYTIAFVNRGSSKLYLYDDKVGYEIDFNHWTWISNGTGFAVYVCNA